MKKDKERLIDLLSTAGWNLFQHPSDKTLIADHLLKNGVTFNDTKCENKRTRFKTFFDHEGIFRTQKGATYMTMTTAVEQLEDFVNNNNIEIINTQFFGRGISIIYKEIEK